MPIEGRFNNPGHPAEISDKVDLILGLRNELREAYGEIGRLTNELEEMEIADQLTNLH